jgi:pyruvate formate lyase activating enzyme
MNISAFQPVTLSDFPGKVAALVFTQGCNFRCPYCHNPSLLKNRSERVMDADDVLAFLIKRMGKLQGLVISGGEPTMQAGLIPFLREVKKLDYSVKLDTNGSFPNVLETLLTEKLVDYIAMDIKAPLVKYAAVVHKRVNTEHICRSIEIIMSAPELSYEFRTTALKSQLSKEDLLDCGKLIKGADRYVLQHCNPTDAIALAGKRGEISQYYSSGELLEIRKRLYDLSINCRIR